VASVPGTTWLACLGAGQHAQASGVVDGAVAATS